MFLLMGLNRIFTPNRFPKPDMCVQIFTITKSSINFKYSPDVRENPELLARIWNDSGNCIS